MASPDPRAEIDRRLGARRIRHASLQRRDRAIANWRLVLFGGGLALAATCWLTALSFAWLGVPAAAFVVLVFVHDGVIRATARAAAAVAFYERAIARLDGTWPGTGITGTDYAHEDHPYARDLDLFGPGSLFELLCTTRTRAGEETLARWLCSPATVEVIRARQAAVDELRPRLDLREDLALDGGAVRAKIDPEALVTWATAPPRFHRPALVRGLAWLGVTIAVAAVAAWALTPLGPGPLVVVAIADAVFLRLLGSGWRRAIASAQQPRVALAVLAVVLRRLQSERFTSPLLVECGARLGTGTTGAAAQIRTLERLATWLDAQRNQLWAIPAFFLLWGVHFALAIESWRQRNGGAVGPWLSALGELEALAALATYAYEHPLDPHPRLVARGVVLNGTDLGHPLLPAATRVRNSVQLGDGSGVRALVVSGSNMSGKSTLLRTIGINVALALAGAPVCATSLELSVFSIGATLRVLDSLRGGRSRFYAEISRLRQLLELCAGDLPVLFLLDEILHGTNSHDRQIGAAAIIRVLIDAGAIGLVTTHDLALAATADDLAPRAQNVHFRDELSEGELHFDYRLRAGVVTRSNALELMRSIGLPV